MGRIQCSRRPSDGLSCQHVNNDISKLSRILVTVTIIVLNSHIFHTIFCKNTGHLFARCTGGPERAGKGFEDLRRVRCARRRVCWGGAGNRSVEAAGLFGVGSALPAGGRQMAAWDAGDKWLGSTLYGDEQTASPYGTATPTRSKYAALRARGHCRDRALCGEADRLLSVASARVVSRTMFEPIVRHRAPSYPQGNTRPGGALLSELPARRYGLRSRRSLVAAKLSRPFRVRCTGVIGGRTVRGGSLISRGVPLGTAIWNSGRLAVARECVPATGPAQARARLSLDPMPITIASAGLVACRNRRPAGNPPVRFGGSTSSCARSRDVAVARHFD